MEGASEFVVHRIFTPLCQIHVGVGFFMPSCRLMDLYKSLEDGASSVPLTIRQGGGELA
jgi:hypothetical protein